MTLVIVVQENSAEPRTSVFSFDRIGISGGIIPGNILVHNAQISAQDKIAPVLLSAHLEKHDIGDDTLLINISEPVNGVENGQPFNFSRAGGGQYTVRSDKSFTG